MNLCASAMPPKSKRVRQSSEAAAAKVREALKKPRMDSETESAVRLFLLLQVMWSEIHVETPPISMASSSHVAVKQNHGRVWKVQSLDQDQWHADLISNKSKQGQYQRSCVLLSNEKLCERAAEHVRANSTVKGTPNMTVMDFCKWDPFSLDK